MSAFIDGKLFGVGFGLTKTPTSVVGDTTVNSVAGTFNFGNNLTQVTITNKFCTESSVILVFMQETSTGPIPVTAKANNGSFTVYANSSFSTTKACGFLVLN